MERDGFQGKERGLKQQKLDFSVAYNLPLQISSSKDVIQKQVKIDATDRL